MNKKLWLALLRNRDLWKLIVVLLATFGLTTASNAVSDLSGPLMGILEVLAGLGS